MAAVNRAAAGVPRHDGRVVILKYTGENDDEDADADVVVDTTLFMVGKVVVT